MYRPGRTTTVVTGEVLELLHQAHWLTADEIGCTLGRSRECCWRHLQLLVRADLVVKDAHVRPHRYRIAQPRPVLDYL
jgi:predicted transcriptional regulator